MLHPDGEVPMVRAASNAGSIVTLSNFSVTPIEDVDSRTLAHASTDTRIEAGCCAPDPALPRPRLTLPPC
jgi:isopentenyl diphosphate isomerase/L-lactate dehydrogenase-like FMN-dependent dehydrogenase